MTDTQYPAYTERVVAFIDILGFTKIIENSVIDDNEFSKTFYALSYFENETRNNLEVGKAAEYGRIVTAFSDSIVISYPMSRATMRALLGDVLRLQEAVSTFGYFIRGGVTFGKLFHEKGMIFGPALVEAYNMENKIAVYPRVILTPDYFSQFESLPNETAELLNVNPFHLDDLVIQDDDGHYFLDFLQFLNERENEKLLQKVDDTISKENSEPILQKMYWLKNKIHEKMPNKNALPR